MYSLSSNGTLSFRMRSASGWKLTVPSPGVRGSPGPPQRAMSSVGFGGFEASIATQPRLQVKPPFVDRLTQMPFESSVRLKSMLA
jgi:hypothetical protein